MTRNSSMASNIPARLAPLVAMAALGCGLPPEEVTPTQVSAQVPHVSSQEQALRWAPVECSSDKPIPCGITCERDSCAKCCNARYTCETSCSVGGYAHCLCTP